MDKIIESLTLETLLENLAEMTLYLEAAASVCYRTAHDGETALIVLQDARNGLIDAIADVNVAAEAVRRKMGISCDEIAEAEDAKIESWRRRVENGI